MVGTPSTKKVLLFTCKFCGQEFLVARTFIEHKKEHLAAIAIAEAERKIHVPSTDTLENIPQPVTLASQLEVSELIEEEVNKDEEPETSSVKQASGDEQSILSAGENEFTWTYTTTQAPPSIHNDEEMFADSGVGVTSIAEKKAQSLKNPTVPEPFHWLSSADLMKPVAVVDLIYEDGELEHEELNRANEKEKTSEMTTIETQLHSGKTPKLDIPLPHSNIRTRINHSDTEEKATDIHALHPCSVCDKMIKGMAMPGHLRLHHPHKKPFQCFQCPYETTVSSSLRKHRRCHQEKSVMECPYCTASFSTQRRVTFHVNQYHSVEGKGQTAQVQPLPHFMCQFCGKQISTLEILKNHELCHRRRYKSNHCSYASGRQSDLRQHKIARHNSYSRESSNVDDDKERKSRATASSSSASSSQRATANVGKQFKCRYCQRVCQHRSKLRRHEDSHTRPYKCSRCPHRCGRTADLITHEARGRCRELGRKDTQNLKPNREAKTSPSKQLQSPMFQPSEAIPMIMPIQIVPARKVAIHPPGFYTLETQTQVHSNKSKSLKTSSMDTVGKAWKESGTTGEQILPPRKEYEGNWGTQCPHCDYTSFSASSLRKHVEGYHSGGGKKMFDCSDCPTSYVRKVGLETHRKKCHAQESHPEADAGPAPTNVQKLCPMPKQVGPIRPTPTPLSPAHGPDHQAPLKRNLSKSFSCTICKEVFSRLADLQEHAQLACRETWAEISTESRPKNGGQGVVEQSFRSGIVSASTAMSTTTETDTAEKSKDATLTTIEITQKNDEGLKITSVRFI